MRSRLRLVPEGVGAGGHVLGAAPMLLGRAPDCGVRLDAAMVSSRHALVCEAEDGFYVADQKSTNGTWVNGARVETAWLRDGDVIRLGPDGPSLRVAIEDGAAEELASAAGQVAAAVAQVRAAEPPATAVPAVVVPDAPLTRTFDRLSVANAAKARRDTGGGSVLRWIAVLAAGGVLALLVGLIMLLELGPGGLLVGTIAAFLPAPMYVAVFVWLDRYDPEPRTMLVAAFAWGALVALFISFVGNTIFGATVTALTSAPVGDVSTAVISAPLIEEGSKGLWLLMMLLALRRHFDGVLDGIVYGGIVALGFATVENVQYYGRVFLSDGFGALLVLGFLRGVLSPFSHALYTCMTGIGCGIARESHRPVVRIVAPVAGYGAAVVLHSLWNLVASVGGEYFFAVYFLVWVPLFAVFLGVVLWLGRRERRIIRAMLEPEVAAGLLTREQLDLVGSFFWRISWRLSALSDRARYCARRDFLATASRLAMCYWHVKRASEAGTHTMSLPNLVPLRLELHALAARV